MYKTGYLLKGSFKPIVATKRFFWHDHDHEPGRFNVTSKETQPKSPRRPPFDFKKKYFNFFTQLRDGTIDRIDGNSKVIVVDGPLSSGKNEVAKYLADQFDMKFVPEPTMDVMYIDKYHNFDYRSLDYRIPQSCRTFDENDFLKDPYHSNVGGFQINKFRVRYSEYYDELAHLYNSGQGVVLVRSPYSHRIFVDAMAECGYISRVAQKLHYTILRHTVMNIQRPHIVVNLNVPVNIIQENIKKDNNPLEVNSPALTTKYLTAWNDAQKSFVEDSRKYSVVLDYDWSSGGDLDLIVEDIEKIDFNKLYGIKNGPIWEWYMHWPQCWIDHRVRYSWPMIKENAMVIAVEEYEDPTLLIDGEDDELVEQVYDEHAPGNYYEPGYNPNRESWWSLAFKTKYVDRWPGVRP